MSAMSRSHRIAVLFGGSSAEREVSLESGQTVANALRQHGFFADLIDPADTPVKSVDWPAYRCAFVALHGTYGEDGTVQRELDLCGVRYTGSSALASAIAFDKPRAKEVFRKNGLPTPDAATVSRQDSNEVRLNAVARIGVPLVVKPASQGSSVGVTIVVDAADASSAFERCFQYDDVALVERFVRGEEWTVGVIDDRPLPPIRIESAREFYDYEAKYTDDRTGFFVQSEPSDSGQRLQEISVRACKAIGTAGIARVDLMVDESGAPWILEVNTIPGFTSHSLIPKAASAVGMGLGEMFASVLPVNPDYRRAAAG